MTAAKLRVRLERIRRRRSWIAANIMRRDALGRSEASDRLWPSYERAERCIYAILCMHPELRRSDEEAA